MQNLSCFGIPLQFVRMHTNPQRWLAGVAIQVAVELEHRTEFNDWKAELWLADGDGCYGKVGVTLSHPSPQAALDALDKTWQPRAVALTQALDKQRRIQGKSDGD